MTLPTSLTTVRPQWLRLPRPFRSDWRIPFGLLVVILLAAAAVLAPLIAPHDPNALQAGPPLSRPNGAFLMGTDPFGRDQLSRVLFGARISIGVAAVVAVGAVAVGLPIGLLAGYVGRHVDYWTGRLIDLMFAFPGLLLALALTTIFGPSIRTATLALAVVYMPIATRFIRAAVARERRQDYILAAEIGGASTPRILVRHLLPNIMSELLVIGTLIMSFAVLAEAGLSFLGLGVQPPAASWGRMLTDNRSYVTTAPHLVIFPGAAITLLVLALSLLGDGLRDHLDPLQSRRQRGPAATAVLPGATG
jgi:ABC-type dipeptide/oligopeptide/nickel transport system permease subunit